MFFQRKNSKKAKDSGGSQKKGKDGRGKNDLFDRAKGGLDALAGSLQSAKNEQGEGSEGQGNKDMDAFSAVMDKVKSHPEMVEKVKDEVMGLADALRLRRHGSEEKEAGSEEKAGGGEAAQSVDEGASDGKAEEPSVLEQAVQEIQAVAAALQQTAETEAETPAETAAAAAENSAEGDRPEETNREVEKDDPKKRLDFAGFFAMLLERCCSPASKKKD